LDFREANAGFCAVSYRLDHPDLPASEIPLVHYLRGHDGGRRPQKPRGGGFFTGGLPYSAIDSQRLADCASDEAGVSRRAVTARYAKHDRNARYEALGERLAGVEFWSKLSGDDTELATALTRDKRVAVYAVEPASGGLGAHHRLMLDALSRAGYTTVIACDAATRPMPAITRKSTFGSRMAAGAAIFMYGRRRWRIWRQRLWMSITCCSSLTSFVGPWDDLRPLLRRLERSRAEITGLTRCKPPGGRRLLHADFLMVAGETITSGALGARARRRDRCGYAKPGARDPVRRL